jgi:hypothetical protein
MRFCHRQNVGRFSRLLRLFRHVPDLAPEHLVTADDARKLVSGVWSVKLADTGHDFEVRWLSLHISTGQFDHRVGVSRAVGHSNSAPAERFTGCHSGLQNPANPDSTNGWSATRANKAAIIGAAQRRTKMATIKRASFASTEKPVSPFRFFKTVSRLSHAV